MSSHNDHYQVDKSLKAQGVWRARLVGFLLPPIIVVAGAWVYAYFRPTSKITMATPTASTVRAPGHKTFKEPMFTIALPANWAAQKTIGSNAPYQYRGQDADDATRSLAVYVDTIPTGFAVNRLLPIEADNTTLETTAGVSDNCINFTDTSQANPQTGVVAAKWGGVKFWCDTVNYQRNVVGAGSAEANNAVTVKGASGSHRYFFVYTDHSTTPEYEVFTSALDSFKAL